MGVCPVTRQTVLSELKLWGFFSGLGLIFAPFLFFDRAETTDGSCRVRQACRRRPFNESLITITDFRSQGISESLNR